MDKILRGRGGTLPITVYDANGNAADAGGGNGTAAVTDSAGVAVAGSPFTAVHGATGVYTVTIPATLTTLDDYTVNWTFPDASTARTPFQIVGGFYFTIAELRAQDGTLTSYPADSCRAVRDAVEDRFEQHVNTAFVPRGRRWTFPGSGTWTAVMPDYNIRSIVSVTQNGTALSAPSVAAIQIFPGGVLQRTDGIWLWPSVTFPQNITVLYEHGLLEPPAPVKAFALRYARHLAVPTAFDADRMISYQTDVGTIQQAIARNGQLGFPDIDSVLADYGFQPALVG